jgi:hypothetical protein
VWQASFSILDAFAQAHGSVAENEFGVSVFDGLLDAEHRSLGRWIARQRQARRAGTLPVHQATALQSLPGWTWTPVPEADLAMVDALRGFVEWEKHADVPDTHVEDGLKLGAWCWTVRRRRLTGRLHPALFDEITAASPPKDPGVRTASCFPWKVDETQWRLALSALRQYAQREGHSRVPGGHVEYLPDATVRLGMWVAKQRHDYRRGRLDPRYPPVLAAVPGWVWKSSRAAAYGAPIHLGQHRHGTASGVARKCPCEACVEYSRAGTRTWQAKRRQLADGVPAQRTCQHLATLQAELAVRMREIAGDQRPPGVDAIAVAANIPVGVLRSVAAGRTDIIRHTHEVAILAVGVDDVLALFDGVGSRGRLVMTGHEKVPAGPTRDRLAELYRLGWPPIRVAEALGYDRKVQVNGATVTRRVAAAVEKLHATVAGRSAPAGPGRKLPPLADLETAAPRVPAAKGQVA